MKQQQKNLCFVYQRHRKGQKRKGNLCICKISIENITYTSYLAQSMTQKLKNVIKYKLLLLYKSSHDGLCQYETKLDVYLVFRKKKKIIMASGINKGKA